MGKRGAIIAAAALVLGLGLSGCAATSVEEAARTELSNVVDQSIQRFDEDGGSETTSAGDGQYALIYDPSAPGGRQVVTADLADSTSPAFGDVSTIAIHSMRTLLDSSEFAAAKVEAADGTFTAAGDSFRLEVRTRDGLVTQLNLDAGTGETSASQAILMTYGMTPEARKIFDSVT